MGEGVCIRVGVDAGVDVAVTVGAGEGVEDRAGTDVWVGGGSGPVQAKTKASTAKLMSRNWSWAITSQCSSRTQALHKRSILVGQPGPEPEDFPDIIGTLRSRGWWARVYCTANFPLGGFDIALPAEGDPCLPGRSRSMWIVDFVYPAGLPKSFAPTWPHSLWRPRHPGRTHGRHLSRHTALRLQPPVRKSLDRRSRDTRAALLWRHSERTRGHHLSRRKRLRSPPKGRIKPHRLSRMPSGHSRLGI